MELNKFQVLGIIIVFIISVVVVSLIINAEWLIKVKFSGGRKMENPVGAYALYEFLKELVENGQLYKENDNSEISFVDNDGISHPITDYSFDDNRDLILW